MGWIQFAKLDLHEVYTLIAQGVLVLIVVAIILLLIVKYKYNIKILERLIEFSRRHNQKVKFILIIILILLVVFFGLMMFVRYVLDVSTTVHVKEKIVIVEIDDYWNLNDTMDYFGSFGYSMEDYKEVSDIFDKYGFTASLGVTPFIFVEQVMENFDLADDEEMIEYLVELDEKGYELAMHGYNHCRNAYYCPQYEEVWFNVLDGKIELERIFGKSFVTYLPPGNAWTTEQYENVKEAGFLIIGNTHVPKAYFDEQVIITQKGYDPIYVYKWYAKDFKHTSADEWIKEYEKKNLFILQLHCNTFDNQGKLNDLDRFLEYVKNDGARVMTYKEFYDYIMSEKSKGKDISGYGIYEID